MSSTDGQDAAGPRPPGWYPDPRNPGRHRHWDGSRWSELSATTPFRSDEVDPATPIPVNRRPVQAIVAAGVLILLLAVGAWAVLRDHGDGATGSDASTRSTTTEAKGSDDGGITTTAPASTAPEGSGGTSPAGDPTTTPPDGDPAAPCEVDDAQVLGLLRAYPPLSSLAAGLTVDDARCVGSWATAIVSTPDTDSALAVFRSDGSNWEVVLVGSAEPCAGLGIPDEATQLLGCGDW